MTGLKRQVTETDQKYPVTESLVLFNSLKFSITTLSLTTRHPDRIRKRGIMPANLLKVLGREILRWKATQIIVK